MSLQVVQRDTLKCPSRLEILGLAMRHLKMPQSLGLARTNLKYPSRLVSSGLARRQNLNIPADLSLQAEGPMERVVSPLFTQHSSPEADLE